MAFIIKIVSFFLLKVVVSLTYKYNLIRQDSFIFKSFSYAIGNFEKNKICVKLSQKLLDQFR